MTKLITVIALFAAFTSPAIGEVVSSKQAGKAHCALNKPDSEVSVASSSSSDSAPAKAGQGKSAK